MEPRGPRLGAHTRGRLSVTNHFRTKLEKARIVRQSSSRNKVPYAFGASVVFDERLITQGGQHGGTISGSPQRIKLSPRSQSNQRVYTTACLLPPGSRPACAERAVLQIALPTLPWKPFYYGLRGSADKSTLIASRPNGP